MKFSRYNILSSQLSTGDFILMNSMAGTLDRIDHEAYDLILTHSDEEELSQDVLDEMDEVRDHFLDRGYLTELDSEGELSKAEEFGLKLAGDVEKTKWTVLLLPSLGCNYRCTYCFEHEAGYPAVTMSRKQVDAVFEIIKGQLEPGAQITLYGGEPLAKENRELIEYIVSKGKADGYSFFAVTNGHDLDSYMDLVGQDGIGSLQISVDGPREIHDRRRIALDKASSYDRIMSNIETALRDTDAVVNLRINLDKKNVPFVTGLLEELKQRGILDAQRLNVAANQVIGAGDLTVTARDLRELEETVEAGFPRFKDMFTGRTMASNDLFVRALYFGEPVPRRVTVCGASGSMKLFSPDGKIYSCWSCLGYPGHVIGTFDDEGHVRWNREVLDAWKHTMLPYNRDCLGCRYAFLCAGGCHRPALPGETSAAAYECDYYKTMFGDYLARVADAYLVSGNGSSADQNQDTAGS